MTLVIHCTREQVTYIAAIVGKIHLNSDGTKNIIVPKWIEVMWKYARVHEFREMTERSRNITHYSI